MAIASDFTVAVNGNIRHSSGASHYTVLELHRFLEALAATAAAVWDEEREDHEETGTFGATSEWTGDINVDAVADAVWDEAADEHTADGTMGELENKLGTIDLAKPKIIPGD